MPNKKRTSKKDLQRIDKSIRRDGWAVFDLPNPKPPSNEPRHLATENEGDEDTHVDLRDEKAWE